MKKFIYYCIIILIAIYIFVDEDDLVSFFDKFNDNKNVATSVNNSEGNNSEESTPQTENNIIKLGTAESPENNYDVKSDTYNFKVDFDRWEISENPPDDTNVHIYNNFASMYFLPSSNVSSNLEDEDIKNQAEIILKDFNAHTKYYDAYSELLEYKDYKVYISEVETDGSANKLSNIVTNLESSYVEDDIDNGDEGILSHIVAGIIANKMQEEVKDILSVEQFDDASEKYVTFFVCVFDENFAYPLYAEYLKTDDDEVNRNFILSSIDYFVQTLIKENSGEISYTTDFLIEAEEEVQVLEPLKEDIYINNSQIANNVMKHSNDLELIATAMGNYFSGFIKAVNSGEFSYVAHTMLYNSSLYNTQKGLVDRLYGRNIKERIDYYEILNSDISNINNGVVKIDTFETYTIIYPEEVKVLDFYYTYTVGFDRYTESWLVSDIISTSDL